MIRVSQSSPFGIPIPLEILDGGILVFYPGPMVDLEVKTDDRVPEIGHGVFACEKHVVVHVHHDIVTMLWGRDIGESRLK